MILLPKGDRRPVTLCAPKGAIPQPFMTADALDIQSGTRKCPLPGGQGSIGLPYGPDSIFHVHDSNYELFKQFAVDVGKPVRYMPATVNIRVPQQGAQRQVDSINRLCGDIPTAPCGSGIC
jgi:hypothetical protein